MLLKCFRCGKTLGVHVGILRKDKRYCGYECAEDLVSKKERMMAHWEPPALGPPSSFGIVGQPKKRELSRIEVLSLERFFSLPV